MSIMANILVKDDAATPKEWTLIPVGDDPPSWRGNDTAIPLAGQPRLTVSDPEQLKSGDWKVTAKLEVPVMETLGASGTSAGYVAPPSVAYTMTYIFTMFAPSRSTLIDRANGLKMMVGILQGASSTTGTGILANTAAGSAWASSVLPITQFFTSLVVPN